MNRCAQLIGITIGDRGVRLAVRTAEGPVELPIACEPDVVRALHHCHGPTTECTGAASAMVGTLRSLVGSFGGAISRVVVRPGEDPAFWVRVGDHDGWREVRIDLVSAMAMIAGGGVPLELTHVPATDWDAALRALSGPP